MTRPLTITSTPAPTKKANEMKHYKALSADQVVTTAYGRQTIRDWVRLLRASDEANSKRVPFWTVNEAHVARVTRRISLARLKVGRSWVLVMVRAGFWKGLFGSKLDWNELNKMFGTRTPAPDHTAWRVVAVAVATHGDEIAFYRTHSGGPQGTLSRDAMVTVPLSSGPVTTPLMAWVRNLPEHSARYATVSGSSGVNDIRRLKVRGERVVEFNAAGEALRTADLSRMDLIGFTIWDQMQGEEES